MCFYFLIFNNTTLEEKFYHINDDLLVKQLLGEATPQEEQEVMQWLSADAGNRAYYDQLKQVWDTSRELATRSEVDENKAWKISFRYEIIKGAKIKTTITVYFMTPNVSKEIIAKVKEGLENFYNGLTIIILDSFKT